MNLVPLRRWKELGSAEQYIAYSRYSLLFTAVPLLLFLGWMTLARAGVQPTVPVVAALAVIAAATGWAIVVHPALNARHRTGRIAIRVLVAVQALGIGVSVVGLLVSPSPVFAAVLAAACISAATLPWPLTSARWIVAAVVGVLGGWASVLNGGSWLMGLLFAGFAPLTMLIVWTIELVRELERARATQSRLQVAEERLRFAQELHDTLGQHLAAMSVKAELARALLARGDARADGELAELQELTKVSMNEMHEVVTGYRKANLATEVAGLVSLLDDAGVTVTIVGDVFAVPAELRELAAWFVREAATNVVKHSHARSARLTLAEGSVELTNDGVGREPSGALRGLESLQRRAAAHDAAVTARRDGETFHARLDFSGGTA